MAFALRRSTGEPGLELSAAHEQIVAPRRGRIAWGTFDKARYDPRIVAQAADAWSTRAMQEYHSLALFTQLASQVHLLGAPLDWSGAFARMIADEVRHTELCARFSEALGAAPPAIEPHDLHLPVTDTTLRAHVRRTVVEAFCIGETLSGRMFRRCVRAATVPVAKDIVRVIADDETFHGQFGWEAAALLMRSDGPDGPDFDGERRALAAALPELFAHYRYLCGAERREDRARGASEASPEPNFGTLTPAGYARAFYDGMEEDVVPGLVAIGLPEAERAWAMLQSPEAEASRDADSSRFAPR